MEKNIQLYRKLFTSTFMLSAFTFGGGYVIVPLMRKKFVEEFQWIEEKEMLDLVALAQSSPGAMAVNTSILIGYRMGGVLGALVTVFGTVLPPFLIITVVTVFYDALRDNWIANTLLTGMRSGIAAMIVDVIYKMAKSVIDEKKLLPIAVMTGAFVGSYFFNVSIALALLVSGIIGVIGYMMDHRNAKGDAAS